MTPWMRRRFTRFLEGLLLVVAFIAAAGATAFGLDAPALHAPPVDYQPIGTCDASLGRPYKNSRQQGDSPVLFYAGSQLTAVVFLLKQADVQNGRTFTILSDLGNLPLTELSFGPSPSNPYDNASGPGPYYQLMAHVASTQPAINVRC